MKVRQTAVRSIAAIGMAIVCIAAGAQAYPSKPVRFVIPYPPGGASDVTARIIGAKMTEAWGQQVLIDNRPGANGITSRSSFSNRWRA